MVRIVPLDFDWFILYQSDKELPKGSAWNTSVDDDYT